MRQKKKNIRWNTMRILTVGFFGVILAGAFLLWLPICNQEPIAFMDALFTSTSAVCVTGLVTIVPAAQFTVVGKVVLLDVYKRQEYDYIKKIRASYYLLGALLGKYKRAEVALPGGCNIGSRPIDQHLKGFRALGAEVDIEHGKIMAEAERLTGKHIYFDVVSVGATINVMMAATMAEGITILENVAKEPHVVDVANFLNSMGANIRGAGTDVIKILSLIHI